MFGRRRADSSLDREAESADRPVRYSTCLFIARKSLFLHPTRPSRDFPETRCRVELQYGAGVPHIMSYMAYMNDGTPAGHRQRR